MSTEGTNPHWNIESAFEQLEFCGYECTGGKLELNDAYIFLRQEAARLEARVRELECQN